MCALTLSKRIGICSSTHMHLLMHIRINICSRMHVHFNMQYKYIYGACLTGVPRGGGASLARAWGGREPPSIPEAREGLPAQKLSWRLSDSSRPTLHFDRASRPDGFICGAVRRVLHAHGQLRAVIPRSITASQHPGVGPSLM